MTNQSTGFLLVDKPAGITSHDVVDRLRRVTGIKKIGHAGTLDPFATGLMILGVGRPSTKQLSRFLGMDKTYEATFVLGATTPTLDPEGALERSENAPNVSEPQIKEAIKNLTGSIQQIPPMYSAIKKGGKKLYNLARQGKTIERDPREVTIHQFTLLHEPRTQDGLVEIDVRVTCSSGTYIRALARDLAQALQTTGYTKTLRRTHIGPYGLEQAKSLNEITPNTWQSFLTSLD